eukprot:gene30037-39228_t
MDSSKKMMNAMISERRIKSAAKFKIADIPHPFTTNVLYACQSEMSGTDAEMKKRTGRIIEPIRLDKKQSSAKTNANPTSSSKVQANKK